MLREIPADIYCVAFLTFPTILYRVFKAKISDSKNQFPNFFKKCFSKICSIRSWDIDQIQRLFSPETSRNQSLSIISGPRVILLWDQKSTMWLQGAIFGVRVVFWVPRCWFSKSSSNLQHFSCISHPHLTHRKKVIWVWNSWLSTWKTPISQLGISTIWTCHFLEQTVGFAPPYLVFFERSFPNQPMYSYLHRNA